MKIAIQILRYIFALVIMVFFAIKFKGEQNYMGIIWIVSMSIFLGFFSIFSTIGKKKDKKYKEEKQVKYCPKCGAVMLQEAEFCPECGQKIEEKGAI